LPHQAAITIIAPIKPGHIDLLTELLAAMGENAASNGVLPFGKLARVHFARLLVLDAAADLDGQPTPPYLLFMSDIDAPLDRHLDELVEVGGAGLDVWAETPLPSDSPYFDLPNVIMTPHMAGISQSAYQRITDLFCENLRRYLADEELLNIVDKSIGY
jgi:hypothetical protein